MAVLWSSSSVIFPSSTVKPSGGDGRSPFLGFSFIPASKSSVPSGCSASSKRSLQVKCETEQKSLPLVPANQRWMFDETNGPDIWNKTWYPKAADHVNTDKPWYVVDATDKILGRLASTIAVHIRGKNLPTYTPSVDMGAFVIVGIFVLVSFTQVQEFQDDVGLAGDDFTNTSHGHELLLISHLIDTCQGFFDLTLKVNAEKVAVSGKKRVQKLYRRHSGRPGGMKVETFHQLQQRIPERIIEHAVRGMLPKGRLGRALFNHLKVYKGPNHPHEAQKPTELPTRDKRIQKPK